MFSVVFLSESHLLGAFSVAVVFERLRFLGFVIRLLYCLHLSFRNGRFPCLTVLIRGPWRGEGSIIRRLQLSWASMCERACCPHSLLRRHGFGICESPLPSLRPHLTQRSYSCVGRAFSEFFVATESAV